MEKSIFARVASKYDSPKWLEDLLVQAFGGDDSYPDALVESVAYTINKAYDQGFQDGEEIPSRD